MPLYTETVGELRARILKKERTVLELFQTFVQRLEETEPRIRAFIHPTLEIGRAQARRLDQLVKEGKPLPPLAGIPLAIKDNLALQGVPMTCGEAILQGYRPPYTATVLKALDEAGALFMGKTNMDAFAMGSSGLHSHYGPTYNPWQVQCSPGGSSSGSAASVAVGSAVLAVGSDTGGSVRQPAAFCGVVGLRPTYGLFSRYGLTALSSSMDQVGVLARRVEDVALLCQTMAGHDQRDATSIPEGPILLARQGILPEGCTLGVAREYRERAGEAVRKIFDRAIEVLEEEGFRIQEVSLPHLDRAQTAYAIINSVEGASNLARFDGLRYGKAWRGEDWQRTALRSRSEGLGSEVQRRILLGNHILKGKGYEEAQSIRGRVARDFQSVFQDVQALVTPTTLTTAFALQGEDPQALKDADLLTIPAALASLPALSVPCGSDDRGLPVGVQLMGPKFSDIMLLQLGQRLEGALDWVPFPKGGGDGKYG